MQHVVCVHNILDSAIDYHGEFAFSYGYASLSSTSSKDFLDKLIRVALV